MRNLVSRHAPCFFVCTGALIAGCGGGAPATPASTASAAGNSGAAGTGGSGAVGQGGATDAGGSTSAGGAPGTGGSATAGSTSSGGAAGASSGGNSAAGCEGKSGPIGTNTLQFELDGATRTYVVHTPPGYKPDTPSPLVLMFHGLLGTPADFQNETQMNPAADAKGFVAVYPAGLSQSWNAGNCCGTSATAQVDDIGFTNALLDHLEAAYCVDPKRVFAAGMSNGGMFSQRAACELSERIAAIGPVAGTMAVNSCMPKRAVSVIEFHGTLDPVVPYATDGAQGSKSAPATVMGWAQRDGCMDTPKQVYMKGDATCVEQSACVPGSAVRFCTIDGGGHQWPGGTELPFLGKLSKDIDASAEMLTFFLAHPM